MVSSCFLWELFARRSVSASCFSPKIGSETTYFSLAQAPKSNKRQRSQQKGKSAWTAESVGVLQFGQRCFIPPSLTQNAKRRACGNAVQRVLGVRRPRCRALRRARQNLDNFANQVVSVGLRDFNPDCVSSICEAAIRKFDVGKIQLAVNLRRHTLKARFPHHGVV